MSGERQAYLGRFRVSTSETNFGINSSQLSINTGLYYIAGYDGESTEQLAEKWKNTIVDNMDVDMNVAFNGSTGKLDITSNADLNIYFDHSDLATRMGFTDANLGLAATFQSNTQCRCVWLPSKPVSEIPGDVNIWWGRRSSSKQTRSFDGTVYTVQGNELYDGVYGYRSLLKNEVVESSATVNEPLQKFWTDVAHEGKPIRVLFDRGDYSSNTYVTGYMMPPDSEEGEAADVGPFSSFAQRHVAGWDNLWDVQFKLVKEV